MSAPHLFGQKNPPFVSYCANLEDVVVNRVLPQADGFYVGRWGARAKVRIGHVGAL